MKIFGILEIENRTDILAFTAFLISLISIGYAIKAFVQGASVNLFQPTSLIIAASSYDEGGERYIVSIARFAYANSGKQGYSALITDEKIRFKIRKEEPEKEKTITQDWHAFVATTTKEGVFNLSSQIKPVFKSEAAPFVLPGGESESHETFLASRPIYCRTDQSCNEDHNYVTVDEFRWTFDKFMEKQENADRPFPFMVTLVSHVEGEGVLGLHKIKTRNCTIMVRAKDIDGLIDEHEDKGFFTLPCIEAQS